MNPKVRYAVALIIASLIVAAGALFVRRTWGGFQERFDQQIARLKAQRDAGQLDPRWKNVDLDNARIEDFGVPLQEGEKNKLDLALFMRELWYILIPLVFAFCIGTAALIGWFRSRWL